MVDPGHLLGGEFGPGLSEFFPLGVLGGVVGLQGPGGGKLRHLVLTFLVCAEDASGLGHVGSHPIGAGEGDAGGHVPVEVGDGLTTMLVVLVGLDRDARQGCVGVDRTRGAQVSVPGGETGAEQLAEVDLAAGGRQGEEVEVVDVDVTVPVGGGMGRVEHREQVELLGRLGAEAQHRAHRGVAVDVGVLTLDVAVPGVGEGDLAQRGHEGRLLFASRGAALPVEDVCLGRLGLAALHEDLLHDVLDVFDVGDHGAGRGGGHRTGTGALLAA